MGHYATEVEQRTSEFYSQEILIMILRMLWYLIQLKSTTKADSSEQSSWISWFQVFHTISLNCHILIHFLHFNALLVRHSAAILTEKNRRETSVVTFIKVCEQSYSCISLQRQPNIFLKWALTWLVSSAVVNLQNHLQFQFFSLHTVAEPFLTRKLFGPTRPHHKL